MKRTHSASLVGACVVLLLTIWGSQDVAATIHSAGDNNADAVVHETPYTINPTQSAKRLQQGSLTEQLRQQDALMQKGNWLEGEEEEKATDKDPVQQIEKARKQKIVAKQAKQAARVAKGIATMVYRNADKMVHNVKGAERIFAASQQEDEEKAAKEKREAAAAMADARLAMVGAKSAMNAAKEKAIEAKTTLSHYLSHGQVEHAKRMFALRRNDLQGILNKGKKGEAPAAWHPATAAKPVAGGAAAAQEAQEAATNRAQAAAKHAQAVEIGNAAAQKVIQKAFGSVGSLGPKATWNELDGVPSVSSGKKDTLMESGVHFIYDGPDI